MKQCSIYAPKGPISNAVQAILFSFGYQWSHLDKLEINKDCQEYLMINIGGDTKFIYNLGRHAEGLRQFDATMELTNIVNYLATPEIDLTLSGAKVIVTPGLVEITRACKLDKRDIKTICEALQNIK